MDFSSWDLITCNMSDNWNLMSSMIAYKAISVFTSHTYLTHLRRTFSDLHNGTSWFIVQVKSSPYSVFLNHFVCKSSFKIRKQLVAAIATLKRWCVVGLRTAKQRARERIPKAIGLRQSLTKFSVFIRLYSITRKKELWITDFFLGIRQIFPG